LDSFSNARIRRMFETGSDYVQSRNKRLSRFKVGFWFGFVLVFLAAINSSPLPFSRFAVEPVSAETPTQQLQPGSVVINEISGRNSHLFTITLEAAKYLKITIQKGDSNIALLVHGPDGTTFGEWTNNQNNPLEASLITTTPGSYQLTLQSLENDPAPYRYELRIGQPVTAKAADLNDVKATAAYSEANKLLGKWTESALKDAIKQFEQARSAWRMIHDDRAIDALRAAADVHFILSDYPQALNLYELVLKECRMRHDRLRTAMALNSIARATAALGRNNTAQTLLQKTLLQLDSNGSEQERHLVAEAYNYLGEVFFTQGISIKASDYFERARKLWTELGYRTGEAQTKLNLAYTLSSTGRQVEALTYLKDAMAQYRLIGDLQGEARSLTMIGSVYSFQGNEQAAFESHVKALEMLQQIGDREGQGVAVNGVGQAYEDLGDTQAALDRYLQSLSLFEKNESVDSISLSEYKIAQTYRALGNLPQAFVHYDRCRKLSRIANKRKIEAYALKDVADIYLSQNRKGDTLKQYNKVLQLYRSVRDLRGQALTFSSIGDLFFASGEKQRALDAYRHALPLIRSAGDREGEISTLYAIGRSAHETGHLNDALAHIEESIGIIESLQTYLISPELRSTYFAAVHRNYELFIELLMQLEDQRPGHGYAARALQASESARARALVEVLAEARADLRQGMNPNQVEHERKLHEELAAKEQYHVQLLRSDQTRAEADQVAREIRQLTTEEQLLQAEIRQQNPRYMGLEQPKPLTLEQVQAELRGEDTLLLEYSLGQDESYLWAVTENSLDSYKLPGRATVEDLCREVYGLLTARQRLAEKTSYDNDVFSADAAYSEKALVLSRMLLGPVQSKLARSRLLIVSDGFLQYIPFEALPSPGNEQALLVAEHEVVNLPSISTLAEVRRQGTTPPPHQKVVSILADPVFEMQDPRVQSATQNVNQAREEKAEEQAHLTMTLRDFDGFHNGHSIPRLIHTLSEAKAILNLVPQDVASLAIDFDATRSNVLSPEIEHFQIIHFATHSLVNSNQPQLSGILLSMVNKQGMPQNGFLQLRDIYSLKLSAKLVVLSACSTGIGKEVKGEGLISLTRGFIYAGAKSVVASLWKVDDRATAELMTRFYAAMLKDNLPPAAALRVAKESLRQEKRWSAPYYWAAFVLQGEYREQVTVESTRSKVPLIISGLLVLLLCALCGFYVIKKRKRGLTVANR